MKTPRITHVAIRFNGVIHSLPAPNRHHDVIRKIVDEDPSVTDVGSRGDDQGFLNEDGLYLTRKCALSFAVANGQVKNGKLIGSVLTSEDLW